MGPSTAVAAGTLTAVTEDVGLGGGALVGACAAAIGVDNVVAFETADATGRNALETVVLSTCTGEMW